MKLKLFVRYIFPCIFFVFTSCQNEKDLEVTGFAYEGDVISIHDCHSNSYSLPVQGNKDKFGLCILYELTNIQAKNDDFKLNIILDSSGIKLIDTTVLILKNNKEPFIMFAHPKDNRFKRMVYIDDNSKYIKY